MLILPSVRSRTRSANLVAPAPREVWNQRPRSSCIHPCNPRKNRAVAPEKPPITAHKPATNVSSYDLHVINLSPERNDPAIIEQIDHPVNQLHVERIFSQMDLKDRSQAYIDESASSVRERKIMEIFLKRATILILSYRFWTSQQLKFLNHLSGGAAMEEFERKKQQYLKDAVQSQLQRDMAYFEKIKQIDNGIYNCSEGPGNPERQRIARLFKDILLKERDRLAKKWLQELADDRILDQIRRAFD